MSQNTRCPSCATLFKVVADQLRISDGWVRCGQCKEIFDATAYLQEAPVPVLPPDPDLAPDGGAAPSAAPLDVAPHAGGTARRAPSADSLAVFSELPLADATLPGTSPVPAQPGPAPLAVPEPVVPAFLKAPTAPLVPFAWQGAPEPEPEPEPEQARAEVPEQAEAGAGEAAEKAPEEPEDGLDSAAQSLSAEPLVAQPLVPQLLLPEPLPRAPELSQGYELPSADLPEADFDWLAEYETQAPQPSAQWAAQAEAEEDAGLQADEEPQADADLPLPPSLAGPRPAEDAAEEASTEDTCAETPEAPLLLAAPEDAAPNSLAPTFDAAQADLPDHPLPDEELAAPGAAPASLDAVLASEADAAEAALEPSFVRTARRQAFWRQWEVRLVLLLVSLLLLLVLAAQVALHQRNYLAAAQPQWRSVLQALCAPLQCKVAPYRHIASIVIDSSSFNKVQGDAYQFALALKNTSDNVLEVPAIELTLTDAQDQVVLRRVFTRKELSAPRTLAPHGDWSANLQVQLALDGAPIAGYRVLAFYP